MAASNMQDIAELFRTMRFRKKVFGGVDPQDVWWHLDGLQKEYRSAYDALSARCEAVLAAHGLRLTEEEKRLLRGDDPRADAPEEEAQQD